MFQRYCFLTPEIRAPYPLTKSTYSKISEITNLRKTLFVAACCLLSQSCCVFLCGCHYTQSILLQFVYCYRVPLVHQKRRNLSSELTCLLFVGYKWSERVLVNMYNFEVVHIHKIRADLGQKGMYIFFVF